MAIVELSFLSSLSYKGAVELLLQEGYVEEKEVEEQDSTCDKKMIYPYVLYDETKRKIDGIFYAEYCNQVVDDKFIDGRMTREPIKTEWRKSKSR